jgi:hypothetical protein
MKLNTIKVNLNAPTICDDWGWYIDTDSNLFINSNKIQTNNYYTKINNYKLNKLYPINEVVDEYDYYKKNYLEIAELQLECSRPIENKEINCYQLSLYKIGSTTLITGILTYAIFFLI